MTRELITSWTDYQAAVDQLLAQPANKLLIFDHDLAHLQLDTPAHHEALVQQLHHGARIRIVVRDASRLRAQHPRLMRLLATHTHQLAIHETPASLAHLRDSLLLRDDQDGLIRFEQALPRSKILLAESEELRPYLLRFDEIWLERGDAIHYDVSGL